MFCDRSYIFAPAPWWNWVKRATAGDSRGVSAFFGCSSFHSQIFSLLGIFQASVRQRRALGLHLWIGRAKWPPLRAQSAHVPPDWGFCPQSPKKQLKSGKYRLPSCSVNLAFSNPHTWPTPVKGVRECLIVSWRSSYLFSHLALPSTLFFFFVCLLLPPSSFIYELCTASLWDTEQINAYRLAHWKPLVTGFYKASHYCA